MPVQGQISVTRFRCQIWSHQIECDQILMPDLEIFEKSGHSDVQGYCLTIRRRRRLRGRKVRATRFANYSNGQIRIFLPYKRIPLYQNLPSRIGRAGLFGRVGNQIGAQFEVNASDQILYKFYQIW